MIESLGLVCDARVEHLGTCERGYAAYYSSTVCSWCNRIHHHQKLNSRCQALIWSLPLDLPAP